MFPVVLAERFILIIGSASCCRIKNQRFTEAQAQNSRFLNLAIEQKCFLAKKLLLSEEISRNLKNLQQRCQILACLENFSIFGKFACLENFLIGNGNSRSLQRRKNC